MTTTEAMLAKLEQITLYHADQIRDHNERLRAIERENLKLAIYVGIIATIGSLAAQILIRVFA